MATLILNERPPAGLLVAQVVGITASAYLFGQNTSLSLITVPTIMKAPAGLAVRQWRCIFDKGQMMGPPLAVLGAVGVGYVAWCQDPSSTAFKLNLTASILFPSIVPFTFAFIKPTNDKLFAKEKLLASNAAALAAEDDQKEVGTEGGENTHALIDRWGMLNLARALVTGVGVVCAVWGAVEGSGLDLI